MRFDSLNADLRRWLQTSVEAGHQGEALQQALRGPFKGFTFISSRDGVVDRRAFGQMTAWLDRVEVKLRKVRPRGAASEAGSELATSLMRGSRLPAARREHAHLRLQAGLERLYARWIADED